MAFSEVLNLLFRVRTVLCIHHSTRSFWLLYTVVELVEEIVGRLVKGFQGFPLACKEQNYRFCLEKNHCKT